jgi:hypothetical protein
MLGWWLWWKLEGSFEDLKALAPDGLTVEGSRKFDGPGPPGREDLSIEGSRNFDGLGREDLVVEVSRKFNASSWEGSDDLIIEGSSSFDAMREDFIVEDSPNFDAPRWADLIVEGSWNLFDEPSRRDFIPCSASGPCGSYTGGSFDGGWKPFCGATFEADPTPDARSPRGSTVGWCEAWPSREVDEAPVGVERGGSLKSFLLDIFWLFCIL